MSTNVYAKFYVFDQDKKFLRGHPKDVWINIMKNCHEMSEWDDELVSFNFSLPKDVFAKIKDLGIIAKTGHEDDTIKYKLLEPDIENIGFISPEVKIENSKYYIESDNNYVLVSDMFDRSTYNKDLISSCVSEDDLKNGWKILKRKYYQYDGIWINREVLATTNEKYEEKLEKAYHKLYELKSIEKDVKYGYSTTKLDRLLEELEDLKKYIKSKDDSCYSAIKEPSSDETYLDRWYSDIDCVTEEIQELKYKIQAVNQLIGMSELVYDDMRLSYTDEIYIWLYLC